MARTRRQASVRARQTKASGAVRQLTALPLCSAGRLSVSASIVCVCSGCCFLLLHWPVECVCLERRGFGSSAVAPASGRVFLGQLAEPGSPAHERAAGRHGRASGEIYQVLRHIRQGIRSKREKRACSHGSGYEHTHTHTKREAEVKKGPKPRRSLSLLSVCSPFIFIRLSFLSLFSQRISLL